MSLTLPLPALWLLSALLTLPFAAPAGAESPRVMLETTLGDFVIEVDPERAPLTCANFLQYVKDGFYNGTIVHRVENNFVLQGGGYDVNYKAKTTRPAVSNESGNGLSNTRFSVGLARAGNPHSGTSQFYVNISDNEVLNPNPARWGYAVFGKVVEGLEVIDRIGQQPTGDAGTFKGTAPVTQIVIRRAFLLPSVSAPATPAPATPTAAAATPVTPATPAAATPAESAPPKP